MVMNAIINTADQRSTIPNAWRVAVCFQNFGMESCRGPLTADYLS